MRRPRVNDEAYKVAGDRDTRQRGGGAQDGRRFKTTGLSGPAEVANVGCHGQMVPTTLEPFAASFKFPLRRGTLWWRLAS